jgi:hypothetical protein
MLASEAMSSSWLSGGPEDIAVERVGECGGSLLELCCVL